VIRVLADTVINQIAAGEVVERPASVVKELVENSLDAGATSVEVHLKDGGRSGITIVDDGCGMSRADAMLCVERHATSKLSGVNDLEAIGTFGFRGEALPSIASVSRFELRTRRAEDEAGTSVRISGGEVVDVRPVGCAAGTTIIAKDLFFNIPARKKFLRTRQTELAHCLEAVTRMALRRPEVAFRVRHDGKDVFHAPAVDDLGKRCALLGPEGRALIAVDFASDGVRVSGRVAPVGLHKSTAQGTVYLYVNGRFVRDPLVRRAVNEAYRGFVPRGRYPVVVLDIEVGPGQVDVNVHPAKTEVRFRRPREVHDAIQRGLREALDRAGQERPIDIQPKAGRQMSLSALPAGVEVAPRPEKPFELTPPPARPVQAALPAMPSTPAAPAPAPAALPEPPPVAAAPPKGLPWMQAPATGGRYRDLSLVAVIDDLALSVDNGELVAIDLRQAATLVLHRRMRNQASSGRLSPRRLDPVSVMVSADADVALEATAESLAEICFRLERMGPRTWTLTAVPALLSDVDPEAVVQALATEDPMAAVAAVSARVPTTVPTARAVLAAVDETDEKLATWTWSSDDLRGGR